MNELLSITAPVFFLVGLGYLCSGKKMFRGAPKTLGAFVFYCAMPAYLFLNMAKVPREIILHIDYIAAFAVGMGLTAAIGGLLARKIFHQDKASTVLAMMSSCYTNSAFVGIPIIASAFGQISLVVVITLYQVVVVTTTILTTIELFQNHERFTLRSLRAFPRTVLMNPIVGASVIGIGFALGAWTVPTALERTLSLLGTAAIPAALFALGLSLGEKGETLPQTSRPLVVDLVLLKVFVQPAITWMIGRYIFELQATSLAAVTVIAAMPTAVNNFVFAERYNSFIAESGRVVFLSTLISVVTLSALLYLFKTVD